MNRSNNGLALLSLIGMGTLLAMAWGLDAFMEYLRHQLFSLGLAYGAIWTQILSRILLAALLLLLFRFVLTRARRNVWVAGVYIVAGLFFGFFPVLYYVPAIGAGLSPAFYGPLLGNSYTVLAGSFVAVIGVFMLLLPRRSG